MPEFPETSESLIARVSDPADRLAWDEFERLYRPVIFRIARARGMQHSDALDLVQQVLMSVAAAIDRFEKQQDGPPFRAWLSRVTRNAVLKALMRGPRERPAANSDVLDVLSAVPAADPATDALIRLEYRRELFQRAAELVRRDVHDATWMAFELTVLEDQSIEDAATTLGLSIGNVYAARSRVMRKLRDAVRRLQDVDREE